MMKGKEGEGRGEDVRGKERKRRGREGEVMDTMRREKRETEGWKRKDWDKRRK